MLFPSFNQPDTYSVSDLEVEALLSQKEVKQSNFFLIDRTLTSTLKLPVLQTKREGKQNKIS